MYLFKAFDTLYICKYVSNIVILQYPVTWGDMRIKFTVITVITDYAEHFFLGQFGITIIVVVALFLIEFVIFSRLVKYNSVFDRLSMRA